MSGPPTRIPSLDGLRAISIGLVLFGHSLGTRGFLPATRSILFIDYGNVGVRVFFVISGYLISSLLFDELRKTGSISLAKFYFRRGCRIFPAFYANVAIVAALASTGVVTLMPGDLLHAATYTMNYHYDRAWSLGHTWSLAVEEQFYLFWPALLLFLGRLRGLAVAASFVVAAPLVRLAAYELHLPSEVGLGESFQTIGDSIAVGCLLAGFESRLDASKAYVAFQRSPAFFVVPLLAIGAAMSYDRPRIDGAVGETTMNVCIALSVHRCIRHPDDVVGRALNSAPLSYVGALSYSIYLWQQVFLDRASDATYARFPLDVALAIGAAIVSYYVVERPFLWLREQLEPRLFRRQASPPSIDELHP